MKLSFPELSLVVLVGPSGSGKSTFASRHFLRTEVLSSDFFRGLVADDENDQAATGDAFEALHFVAERRLRAGRLTVVDATNVRSEDRQPLVEIARRHHVLPVAIVFALPEAVCHERNAARPDRAFGPHVVRNQIRAMRRSTRNLSREGFRYVFVLHSQQEADEAEIERTRLRSDLRDERGPFDVVGDVLGCYDELVELLGRLGYQEHPVADPDGEGPVVAFAHPEGRKAVFVGDLVDRGPRSIDTVLLVRAMTRSGAALCVPGNHDVRLVRKLRGRDVKLTHGLERTMAELEALPPEMRPRVEQAVTSFLDGLVAHLVLDGGRLVVAHAGLRQEMHGRASSAVRAFALWGETTGEVDELGLPVRYNWAAGYRGPARVVYGHTPVPEPEWLNHTVNIDTGCVFGGRLTALRYPELELVSVPAAMVHWEPVRPMQPAPAAAAGLSPQQVHDELLDLDDVVGKRMVQTRLRGMITVREENALAALEVMSRFATDPRWIVYLPPTMSPSETSALPGYLEHPAEAFGHYRQQGVERVVCQEKHMGSRAVLVVCRDAEAARRRFGVASGESGTCYTRTGRRFFEDPMLDAELIGAVRDAVGAAGWWDTFSTGWVCLDCELMPWSAKAQELLRRQYAPVGSAARAGLSAAVAALEAAATNGVDTAALLESHQRRLDLASRYTAAYRRYCWPVDGVADLRLAPFHLMATERCVHAGQPHAWHMARAAELADAAHGTDSSLIMPTAAREVDLSDAASEESATAWWEELTGRGGEGMVVKPADFVARGRRGLVQPAVKCRGVEYLRIIYGPDYTEEANLERLRSRGLGPKRSLAMREFALGLEALERFVEKEPLRRVHECVFAVLALESEPVDPRL